MTQTTNYGLYKPDTTDVVEPTSREAFNSNADIIDSQLKAINSKILSFEAAASTSYNFTLNKPSRVVLYSFAHYADCKGEYIVACTSGGSITKSTVLDATNLTITSSSNTLTITTGERACTLCFLVFQGSVTGA